MDVRRSLAALSAAAALAGCGGSDEAAPTPPPPSPPPARQLEQPDAFFERLLGHELAGRFGESWRMLHPGHQAVVTRERYASCSEDDFGGAQLKSVETVEIYDQPIDIRHVPQRTSKAVTMKLTLLSDGQEEVSTHTFHAVRLQDRWAWYLGDGLIDAYSAGDCP